MSRRWIRYVTAGVTIALIRKVRMVVWAFVGAGLLARGRRLPDPEKQARRVQ